MQLNNVLAITILRVVKVLKRSESTNLSLKLRAILVLGLLFGTPQSVLAQTQQPQNIVVNYNSVYMRLQDSPVTFTATSSSGSHVYLSAAPASVCSFSGYVMTLSSVGNCTVTASVNASMGWQAATSTQLFAISPNPQTITFTPPATGTYLVPFTISATSTSGQVVQFTNATPGNCTLSAPTVTPTVAGQPCTINANVPATTNFAAAPQVAKSIAIGKANQTVAFTPISAQTYNTSVALSATATSLGAVTFASGSPSTCTVSGNSALMILAGGSCTLTASQSGTANYNSAQASQSFGVIKADQSIPLGAIADQAYGATVNLPGNASSGLAVVYTTSTGAVCSIAGSVVSMVTPGNCVVIGNQPGNTNYNAAPQVTQNFNYLKAAQTIAFTQPANQTYGNSPFSITATASSGLAITSYSSTTPLVCTVGGNTVTIVTAGMCTISATQSGNATYSSASQSLSVPIALAPQTLNVTSGLRAPLIYGASSYTISATASSGLAVSFSSTTPLVCTTTNQSANQATFNVVGTGTCNVTASQSGNTNYAPLSSTLTSTVNPASQSISLNAGLSTTITFGTAPFNVTATASSSLAVTLTSTTPAVCTTTNQIANQSTVNIVGVGTCTINATQAGTANYAAAPTKPMTGTVVQGSQTITFAQPADVPFGTASFNLPATSTSGLIVTLTSGSPTVCSASGTTVSLIGVGICSVTGSQSGNFGYLAAANVARTFNVTDVATVAAIDSIAPPYIANNDAGTLPGNLAVSNSGAATYSIPIAVPPGTAGMAPNLSLNYSSLAGNGIPGYGWTLSGGSSIRRCVKTLAQDGAPAPITLTSSDALCLDGNRLLLVTGTYGTVPSTYRTEIDIGARITMGTTINGFSAFIVETRDGKTMTYGSTADSAVPVIGKLNADHSAYNPTAPLYWDLATVTDSNVNVNTPNNQIVYNYTNNATTGEHLLTSIQYGNAAVLYNSVVFSYECRNGVAEAAQYTACAATGVTPVGDADIEYLAGARVDLRHRLTTITTYTNTTSSPTNGTVAQTTTLKYVISATSRRSLLSTISACAQGLNTCLPVTTFTWGTAAAANTSYPATSFVSKGLMTNAPNVSGTEIENNAISALSNVIGTSVAYENRTAEYNNDYANPAIDYQKRIGSLITGDFYGDGKKRILTADQGESGSTATAGWHIYTVNAAGNGFTVTNLPYSSGNPGIWDRLDFGVPKPSGSSVNQLKYLNSSSVIVGDFDGDGAMDIAFVDQIDAATPGSLYAPVTPGLTICLSRLSTAGNFNCEKLPIVPPVLTTAQQQAYNAAQTAYNSQYGGTPPPAFYRGLFLRTQGNGRSDLFLYNTSDPSSVSDLRCTYTPGTSGWTWSCGGYPGVQSALHAAAGESALPVLRTTPWPWPADSASSINAITDSYAMVDLGDFAASGQQGFMAQHLELTSNTQITNFDLFVGIPSTTSFSSVVGVNAIPNYTQAATNQLVWSSNSGSVQQVFKRYLERESRGTELTGTSLGDINGDGNTDYLFTFEGHDEICYSMGATGFDCRLIDDQTPAAYSAPTFNYTSYPSTVVHTTDFVPEGLTIAPVNGVIPDPSGGFGVFSVLSVGHASDSNVQEVIYRRGDGGYYNNGVGGVGGDQYYVCTLHDGKKLCTAWTGPSIRPYIMGADFDDFPIPGVTFVDASYNIYGPTAGTNIGDFTGQGRTQILWYCDSHCTNAADANPSTGGIASPGWQLFEPNVAGPVDRLIQVVNGIGNTSTVTYKPMSDPTVYTPQATDIILKTAIPIAYPLTPVVDNGRLLVNTYNQDAGSGNIVSNTYQYQGLVADQAGRGELGFLVVNVTNSQGIVSSTQTAQNFPYSGMVVAHTTVNPATSTTLEQTSNSPFSSVVSTINTNGTISTSTKTVAAPLPVGGVSYCSYIQTSTQQLNDLNGAPLSYTTNNITGVDGYCNLQIANSTVRQTVNSVPTYSTTVTNTVTNNIQPGQTWALGLVTQSVIIKSETVNSTSITRTKAMTYYNNGLLQSVTQEPSSTSLSVTQFYDRNPTSTCSSGGNVFGLVNCVTQSWRDPVANAPANRTLISATYSAQGQGRYPNTVANALGQTTTFSYDDTTGVKTATTDINGILTSWTANGFGQVLTETRADHTQDNYYFKQCAGCSTIQGATPKTVGFVDHVTDGTLGGVRISVPELNYLDSAGHKLRSQTYSMTGTEIDADSAYDTNGRTVEQFQPAFVGITAVPAWKITSFDALNRPLSVTNSNETGVTITNSANYNGLTTTLMNGLSQSKILTKNPLGQLIQTTDNLGGITQLARDAFGALIRTTDVMGNVVTVTYDNLGRKISLQDPDLGLTTYGIDPRGLQYMMRTANETAAGQTSTFSYDGLDRLVQRTEPDLISNWVYDVPTGSAVSGCVATLSCGKLIEAFSMYGGSKDYDRLQTYDNFGRPKTTTTSLDTTYLTTVNYDVYGRPFNTVQQRGALSKTFGQIYNQFGYLVEVVRGTGSSAQVVWQAQQQDASSNVTQAGLGNGLVMNRSYNPNTGRMTTGCLSVGNNIGCVTSNLEILQEGYVFDNLGNVTDRNQYWNPGQPMQNGVNESFAYDNLNRLTNSTVLGQTLQVFSYDAGGDIISKTGVGTGNYVYPTSGVTSVHPHAVSSIPGVGSFNYDFDGNLLSGNGRSITWTSFDMPLAITAGSNSSSFVYGPEHQRIIQRRTGMTIVYAGGMEVDTPAGVGAAVTVKSYWPLGVGFDIDTLDNTGASTSTVLYWTHTDRLGSVIGITNQSGAVQESMAYDAWGARRNLNGTAILSGSAIASADTLDNKGFTGHEMLDQLDLIHMNGRVYDPLLGRFVSSDPLLQSPTNSQSYNRYSYVLNNPTNFTDPSGFAWYSGIVHFFEKLFSGGGSVGYDSSGQDTSGSSFNSGGSYSNGDTLSCYCNSTTSVNSQPTGQWNLSGGNGVPYSPTQGSPSNGQFGPQPVGHPPGGTVISVGKPAANSGAPIRYYNGEQGVFTPNPFANRYSPECLSGSCHGVAYTSDRRYTTPLENEELVLAANTLDLAVGGASSILLKAPSAALDVAEVPTVIFSRSRAPWLEQNFLNAVENGAPTKLNRVSAAARDANRRAALRGQPSAPAGQSLDEYPFACSAQGGCGSFVRPVPIGEQSYQGGVLSRFFQNNGVQPGDPFYVQFGP